MNAPGNAPYRPLPEAPSPSWGHAALAARAMRWAEFAQIPAALVTGVLSTMGMTRLLADRDRSGESLLLAARAVSSLTLFAVGVVSAYFLARVLMLPGYVRSRRRAVAKLAVGFVGGGWLFASPFVINLVTMRAMQSGAESIHQLRYPIQLGAASVGWLFFVASGLASAALLDGLSRELRGRPVAWAYFVVLAGALVYVAQTVGGIVSSLARAAVPGQAVPLGFTLAGVFAQGALHCAWAVAYARTADTLAQQTAPEGPAQSAPVNARAPLSEASAP